MLDIGTHLCEAVIADVPIRQWVVTLGSLTTCAGSPLWLLLSRGRRPVRGATVNATAERRDEHPTVLTAITLEFVVCGAGVGAAAVHRALAAAEEKLCPVWAMLKPGTPITYSYRVVP